MNTEKQKAILQAINTLKGEDYFWSCIFKHDTKEEYIFIRSHFPPEGFSIYVCENYEYLNVITQMSHYAGLNEYLNYRYGIVYVPNATKRINSLY